LPFAAGGALVGGVVNVPLYRSAGERTPLVADADADAEADVVAEPLAAEALLADEDEDEVLPQPAPIASIKTPAAQHTLLHSFMDTTLSSICRGDRINRTLSPAIEDPATTCQARATYHIFNIRL
jgi:hypothetical protein